MGKEMSISATPLTLSLELQRMFDPTRYGYLSSPLYRRLLTLLYRMLLAVLYWYVWAILIPRWRGYTLEEKTEVLEDGTNITRLVHSKR